MQSFSLQEKAEASVRIVGCHLLLWFGFSISRSFWQLRRNTSIVRMLVLFFLSSFFFFFHRVAVMIVSNPAVLESILCFVLLFFFPDLFIISPNYLFFFLLGNRQWFLECQELRSLYSFGPCSVTLPCSCFDSFSQDQNHTDLFVR